VSLSLVPEEPGSHDLPGEVAPWTGGLTSPKEGRNFAGGINKLGLDSPTVLSNYILYLLRKKTEIRMTPEDRERRVRRHPRLGIAPPGLARSNGLGVVRSAVRESWGPKE